ncbi:TPA: hypothetical protein MJA80_25305 [Klebsiella pneumoniae]|uniref:Uncharacterized protein n=1 Tax=Salmonella enterica subsp. enterica serovar Poona TaxID=436295 RepID=A0A731V0N3_SALET|nr:hypothetical protein [Klebsiella pneumoniae]HAE4776309.1 hypothetical protein [Salmonella enterica subsp. enterica serovar Poona]QDC87271.1 hypothetical protein FIU12_27125 [Klebsiella pneumoniae]HBY9737950.1 hypothetical protein [Klebsiella pneumoniae]HBY9763407.1 hypothetical protein [Klebsiella pneumoniae]
MTECWRSVCRYDDVDFSYCESDEMDCGPGRINAGPLSLNVSRWHFSFAVNVGRKLRRLRVGGISIASHYS